MVAKVQRSLARRLRFSISTSRFGQPRHIRWNKSADRGHLAALCGQYRDTGDPVGRGALLRCGRRRLVHRWRSHRPFCRVAISVPGEVYTIPPSSPLHYVTYVHIYSVTPDTVVVGYTPEYMGAVVSPDGTVVYGTGYTYMPYVGTVYYGYPPTYGYGATFALGAAEGFAFGFAVGAFWGAASPYWGPYCPAGGCHT